VALYQGADGAGEVVASAHRRASNLTICRIMRRGILVNSRQSVCSVALWE